jgi:predicted nucleotidyltransferase
MTRRLDSAPPFAMRESATIELGCTRLDPQVLAAFADRHHITRISLFGSALRGEDGPESDIDLLVQFEPNHAPGFLTLATMEAELSVFLGGRRVDLRTAADLSRHFRDDIVREARLLPTLRSAADR